MKKHVTAAAGLLALAATAFAQPALAEWPEKPVTITVGFGAGGGVDALSRVVGKALSEDLGQPIVVQNRPGAGGAVAVTALKPAAADGYNLVATTSTTLTFDPHATKLAFSADDYTYIAAIGTFPEAFVALPERNWKTLEDLLAEAKASDKPLNYASTTSIDRVVTAAIAEKAGVTINPVPTKGGAEAVAQVLGGHVDFAYSSGTYYAQAKAGKLNVLAALGDNKIVGFEDSPTLQELGYDVASVNYILFLGPKDMPAEVTARLATAFEAATKDADVQALLAKRNMGTFAQFGDDISATIHKQSDQFGALVK